MANFAVGSVVTVEVAGGRLGLTVDEVDSATSPHTGRQLSKLQTTAKVAGSHGEAVAAAVGEASGRGGYLQDDEGRRWHVAGNSHSYSPGGPYRF